MDLISQAAKAHIPSYTPEVTAPVPHLPGRPPREQAARANSTICWRRGELCVPTLPTPQTSWTGLVPLPTSLSILAPAKPVPSQHRRSVPTAWMVLRPRYPHGWLLPSFGSPLKCHFYGGAIPDHSPKVAPVMPSNHLTAMFPSQDWELSESTWFLVLLPH